MSLKSDSKGFLVGEQDSNIKVNYVIDEIDKNVKSIDKSLKTIIGLSSFERQTTKSGVDTFSGGNRTTINNKTIEQPIKDVIATTPTVIRTSNKKDNKYLPPKKINLDRTASTQPVKIVSNNDTVSTNSNSNRDSNGRFVKGSGGGGKDDTILGDMGEKTNKLLSSLSVTMGGMNEVDPTVKAVQEITQPLKVLSTPFKMLFGGDKKTKWFKKIVKLLTVKEKVDKKFQDKSLKISKKISLKKSPKGGGGSVSNAMGGIGNLMGKLPVKAMAMAVIPQIATVAATTLGLKKMADSSPKTMKFLGKIGSWIGSKVFDTKEKVKTTYKKGKNMALGATSKLFESGNKGVGTISSGRGDHGGASYGEYQLSSKSGTLAKYLKTSKYKDEFKGLKAGSKGFNSKWKSLAKNDEGFGKEQHDFIKKTHYDKQISKLKKKGLDLSKRGKAVQDSVWSTSVQFGGNSSLIEKALKGEDVDKLKDADIIKKIQGYKERNNDKLFKSSSPAVRKSTLNRARKEKDMLLALNSSSTAMNDNKPAAKIKEPVKTPEINKQPALYKVKPYVPKEKDKIVTAENKKDLGQDVSDRKIAHIATGGYSDLLW